ncbi:MAG: nucleotide sugar dehydrogenase [Fibromonadaceae bacterium]|jgi:UDP-N-acetyl-D-mannosaminuronic acid dehydrogenase|nr:nucleotide sugar dehydrogenase [Fibromonadaceae bacterium]
MNKICIIGGCGHVGLPLGLAFASKSFFVTLVDLNSSAVEKVNKGELPFKEEGAEELLKSLISKNVVASVDITQVKNQDVVIFVTGTPVDEHHNPKINEVLKVIRSYENLLSKEQLIILRSTLFPGSTELIAKELESLLGEAKVAFCPERILQGKALEEIFTLPQIVAANSDKAYNQATELFSKISPKIIRIEPKEAEIVKLMTNTWRYLEFAVSNAFYMIAENDGLDFYKILNAIKDDYPRAKHFPSAGLAAGPCLFKDTMQLSAFYENNFFLGQSAMLVNEGLPNFLVQQLEKKIGNLSEKRIALLGMTFKANNDDTRESLSFKIKKILEFRMAKVITHDPYLQNEMSLQETLNLANGVILGTPHNEYKKIIPAVPYVDCWGIWPR